MGRGFSAGTLQAEPCQVGQRSEWSGRDLSCVSCGRARHPRRQAAWGWVCGEEITPIYCPGVPTLLPGEMGRWAGMGH